MYHNLAPQSGLKVDWLYRVSGFSPMQDAACLENNGARGVQSLTGRMTLASETPSTAAHMICLKYTE